ncbi:hypothetical protein [Paraburkholderia aspalathi]|uniref:hypothetical protein n=1 Tax=Paraburkholderia aspalathi TaxID=1324617 RepID=UPI001B089D5A|nr:hypothetical protein [Paraburkholderia aspalathi]CAE6826821.1 hypothetical protein R20943_06442 [Paraburkholderia aspalathi]
MLKTARTALANGLYHLISLLNPGIRNHDHEVEVRNETDWAHPSSHVVAAPAGSIALVKVFDDDDVTAIDLMVDPVIAFAFDRYPLKTTTIRNLHDRDVSDGWLTGDEIEPVTLSCADRTDIVTTAVVLPDGSVACGDAQYASLVELLEEKRKAILAVE